MRGPVLPQRSSRCRVNDPAGITSQVRAVTWICSTCGERALRLEVLAGWTYVACQRYLYQQKAQRWEQGQGAVVTLRGTFYCRWHMGSVDQLRCLVAARTAPTASSSPEEA